MHSFQAMRNACTSAVSVCKASFFSITFFIGSVLTVPAGVTFTVALTSQAMMNQAHANPVCSSAAADSDGDGWGWENNSTCVVGNGGGNNNANANNNSSATASVSAGGDPVCSSAVSDHDGDGWGWENNRSCVVGNSGGNNAAGSANNNNSAVNNNSSGAVAAVTGNGDPVCSSAVSDHDGDGWGWENNRSCVFSSSSTPAPQQATQQVPQAEQAVASGSPVCASAVSDTDNDGWGFENGASCIVTAASAAGSTTTSVVTPGVAPPPVAAAVPGFSNDGNPICLTDASDDGNNGFGFENDRTCRVVPGTTATRDRPLLNQRSCIPWLEIGYGNYRLQNNVWNASAVYFNNWSQCIELTGGPGNYVAKWDYNWLPREQGNDFAVKSYPQVYYGRKTRFNLSGSVAETGLPELTDRLPQFRVEYDYSETGIVERNVAFESFFHTSCEAEEYNKQYEMMVWVGVPTIRTPGTQVTSVTLSGQEWDVFINPALGWAYVAFVARNPSNRGTLNWNDFVYWSRDQGPSFGVPAMARNTCMGAIELGTETFWGSGTFTLNRFRVSRG